MFPPSLLDSNCHSCPHQVDQAPSQPPLPPPLPLTSTSRGGGAHHRIYLTYMFILTIAWEGPHQRIGSGHTRGLDPLGGSHRRIRSWGGAHRGIYFEFENLREFEFIFETALGYESWCKISCQCTFNNS
jgi:hypothetical protein